MSRIYFLFGVCLVLGIALQFAIIPMMWFRSAVQSTDYELDNERATFSSHNLRNKGHKGARRPDLDETDKNGGQVLRQSKQLSWCPNSDFRIHKKLQAVILKSWSMEEAEEVILGLVSLAQARQATARADSVIPNLVSKSDWFTAEHRGLLGPNSTEFSVRIGQNTFTPGGHWTPNDCLPRWKVAIIIPYRNRSYHLPIFLRHLIPMLQKQRLEFGVFTVNQENDLMFNRAMLMNVGFVESLNFTSWDCFVFHDVDHIPLSVFNYYGCDNMPRHFLSGESSWNYTLTYGQFFGAVTGFRRSDVLAINGFPNRYWGWGGEDDDIYLRVKKAKLKLAPRPRGDSRYIGFYKTIEQQHESAPKNPQRYELLKNFSELMDRDGLSNLKYPAPRIEIHPLYINISVDISEL